MTFRTMQTIPKRAYKRHDRLELSTMSNSPTNISDKLAPLADIQRVLEEQLGLASLGLQSTSVNAAALFDQDIQCSSSLSQYRGLHEPSVYSSGGWKSARESTLALLKESDREDGIALELAKYQKDIKELWEDDVVMEVLSRQKVRLEDKPGL